MPRSPAAAPSDPRLLWRCRRGMKELDLLLERFARERFGGSPPEMQRAFERLLELPDPVLVELFLGGNGPPDGELATAAMTADAELAQVAALVVAPGGR